MVKTVAAILFCLQVFASESYTSLAITDKEAKAIREIVTILGKPRWGKYLYLAAKTFYLREKGEEANDVHPLRFIGYICADAKLKDYLGNIKDDSWIWPQFIGPLGESLEKKAKNQVLAPYIQGFADELHVDPKRVEVYIDEKNFDGLVDYLIGKNAHTPDCN